MSNYSTLLVYKLTTAVSVGNPGLIDWYTPFLAAIYEKSQEKLNILAHGLVGHTPGVDSDTHDTSAVSLHAQIEHVVEVIDAVKSKFARVVIIGHSVGSWISLQASNVTLWTYSNILSYT